MIINKKEYPDEFVYVHHEEYFNLKIYPDVALEEQEAGLLNELVEIFQRYCEIEFLQASNFLTASVQQCKGKHVITYLNGLGEFNGLFVLALEGNDLDRLYTEKVRIHGLKKVLYLPMKNQKK